MSNEYVFTTIAADVASQSLGAIQITTVAAEAASVSDGPMRFTGVAVEALNAPVNPMLMTAVAIEVTRAPVNEMISSALGVEVVRSISSVAGAFDSNIPVGFIRSRREAFIPTIARQVASESLALPKRAELNPHRPDIPIEIDAVSRPLHGFMADQAKILRDQHNLAQTGGTTYSWDVITSVDKTQTYRLGSVGRFFSEEYGIIQARYVRFRDIVPFGDWPFHPAGFLSTAAGLDWTVTNDFSKSSADRVLGFIAAYETIVSESYGWIIIDGVNVMSMQLVPGLTVSAGDALVWAGTDLVGTKLAGVICARVWKGGDSFRVLPGDGRVQLEGETAYKALAPVESRVTANESAAAALDGRLTPVESTVAEQGDSILDAQNQLLALAENLLRETEDRKKQVRRTTVDQRDFQRRVYVDFKAADALIRAAYQAADEEVRAYVDARTAGADETGGTAIGLAQTALSRIALLTERISVLELGSDTRTKIVYSYTLTSVPAGIIDAFLCDQPLRILAGAPGSQFKCIIAPSANTTWTLRKNGVAVGTVLFTSGSTSGALTWAADIDFAAGDTLEIIGPSPLNGQVGFLMALVGEYS